LIEVERKKELSSKDLIKVERKKASKGLKYLHNAIITDI